MFQSEENIRNIADMQNEAQQELIQKICDILIAGGYFRARLNIDPFDKVLLWQFKLSIDSWRNVLVYSRKQLQYWYRILRRFNHGSENQISRKDCASFERNGVSSHLASPSNLRVRLCKDLSRHPMASSQTEWKQRH